MTVRRARNVSGRWASLLGLSARRAASRSVISTCAETPTAPVLQKKEYNGFQTRLVTLKTKGAVPRETGGSGNEDRKPKREAV